VTIFPVFHPITGQVTAEFELFDAAAIDRVVGEAAAAAREWDRWAPTRRGEALGAWADLIVRHAMELAVLDADAMGRVVRDTVAEAPAVAERCHSWAGLCDKLGGQQLPLVSGRLTYVRRAPLGVVAVLLPWWGPLTNLVDNCAAALACGNAVVVKPSMHAVPSAARLGQLAVEAGLPAGLVRVATGDDVTGRLLATHPRVAAVRVVGRSASVREVRAAVAAAADAERAVKVSAGPGSGRHLQLVFADADLDAAAEAATAGVFTDAGRAARPATRVLVERTALDELAQRLRAAADAVVLGDPHEPRTTLGPLPSQRHVERVREYVSRASASGASVRSGGAAQGCLVGPSLITGAVAELGDVDGPVLALAPFDSEEQAVAMANGLGFRPAVNVWTSDFARLWRVPESLAAAMIWVNGGPGEELADAGQAELEELSRPQRVSVHYGASGRRRR
jgi:acyl-CoA reductase-like NAD-dependent aldehyde dehydrogenase